MYLLGFFRHVLNTVQPKKGLLCIKNSCPTLLPLLQIRMQCIWLRKSTKEQLSEFISSLHGHVGSLLMELYSPELQLFKDLVSIKENSYRKRKCGPLHHSQSINGIVEHCWSGPILVRLIHTKDEYRVGALCIKHGSAKERKKIIEGMKSLVVKTVHDKYGIMVLACIFSEVNDTKLVSKIIINEFLPILKKVVIDKSARRPLLQLLHPYCDSYFTPEDLTTLNMSIPSLSVLVNEGERKDKFTRRRELLIDSGLAEKLIEVCCEIPGELLKSKFGKDVIYEVATGGADGILHTTLDEKLKALYESIVSLVAEAKIDGSKDHILDQFHSSRTLRKLVLNCPAFALTLWTKALQGKCETLVKDQGTKVLICAFLKTSDPNVSELAMKELQPLIDSSILKVPGADSETEKEE